MFKNKNRKRRTETILQSINYGKNGPCNYCNESEGQSCRNKSSSCAFLPGLHFPCRLKNREEIWWWLTSFIRRGVTALVPQALRCPEYQGYMSSDPVVTINALQNHSHGKIWPKVQKPLRYSVPCWRNMLWARFHVICLESVPVFLPWKAIVTTAKKQGGSTSSGARWKITWRSKETPGIYGGTQNRNKQTKTNAGIIF